MKAIIIGGGIGGLCTAIALQRVGIDTEVFEAVKKSNRSGQPFPSGPTVSNALIIWE